MAQPTLLGIFAHPDDESFGPGGTLAKYVAAGMAVHVIIATDGIAGSTDEETVIGSHETLADVRMKELDNAAQALGLAGLWKLHHRDSGMAGTPENDEPDTLIQQPVEDVIRELVVYMRKLRPQVVITHDPHGGYGHPDHIMCCKAASAAFYVAGDPAYQLHDQNDSAEPPELAPYTPQKLYYTAFDKTFLKRIVWILRLLRKDPTAFGRNKDVNLLEISEWDSPVTARIDVGDFLAVKEAASQAHASQYSGGPAFFRKMPRFLRRRIMGHETFTQIYPPPSGPTATDLFDEVFP